MVTDKRVGATIFHAVSVNRSDVSVIKMYFQEKG
jgi:hypothetical protein